MTIRNLQYLMTPSRIALIGASEKLSTVGAVLTRNLLVSRPDAAIDLVNPRYSSIAGAPCFPDVSSLPKPPDMAVIATPRHSVPGLVRELAAKGTKAVVIVSSGFGEGGDEEGEKLRSQLLEAARPHLVRIVGPNCLGIIAPPQNLNASMAHVARPIAGRIAFVAQSGAVQTSVLDWAMSRGIGFSHLISLGDMVDVDFADVLDYLATDYRARAIILYMEAIPHARKFMSAARAAARSRPVIVLKAGRTGQGALAAARHTGSIAGDDTVIDAAFRRAGMLRVYELQELFDAVETLAMLERPITGDSLTILTNGGGVGVIATDVLIQGGGRLAELSPEVRKRLDGVLPPGWSQGNPVDVVSDASAQRYAEALRALLEDQQTDAVLALYCPIGIVSSGDVASAVTSVYQEHSRKPKGPVLFTCWLGDQTAREARALFAQNRIPSYRNATDAAHAFLYMVNHRKNHELLMQTPPSIPESFVPDIGAVLRVVESALAEDRQYLFEAEIKSILSAYQLSVVPCLSVTTPKEAAAAAAQFGGPVALKIISPDIGQRKDLCRTVVCLDQPDLICSTAEGMLEQMHREYPQARFSGFSVQPMAAHQQGVPLLLGTRDDPQFGPVIMFGRTAEPTDDIQSMAIGLPPLNLHLAFDLISRAGVDRFLKRAGCMPRGDPNEVALALVKISQLLCDIAEIVELQINPFLVSSSGVTVVDAAMRVCRSTISAAERLAIRPYPKELEDSITLSDGQAFTLRPIRPEDEPGFLRMVQSLSPEERRMRFMHPMKELSHSQAGRLTQIDYNREMALVLAGKPNPATGEQELYGSVRIISDPDNERAEYAILVRRSVAGKGLGKMLMQRIIDYARSQGIKEIFGQVLRDNIPMLRVCQALGFKRNRDPDDLNVTVVTLQL